MTAIENRAIIRPTVWLEGPAVNLFRTNMPRARYATCNLEDASVVLFTPTLDGLVMDADHPLGAITRAIERVEWHVPHLDLPQCDRVCSPHEECHFVRGPLGETFSSCRLALAVERVGLRRVAIAGLMMGEVLLVEGPNGYAAIARWAEEKRNASFLWPATPNTPSAP